MNRPLVSSLALLSLLAAGPAYAASRRPVPPPPAPFVRAMSFVNAYLAAGTAPLIVSRSIVSTVADASEEPVAIGPGRCMGVVARALTAISYLEGTRLTAEEIAELSGGTLTPAEVWPLWHTIRKEAEGCHLI